MEGTQSERLATSATSAHSAGDRAETPLVITERNDRSTLTRLMHAVVRPLRPRLAQVKLKKQPQDTRLEVPRKAHKIAHVEGRCVEGLWVYDVSSKTKQPAGVPHNRRILYFPGGSWQMPPSPHHWALCAELTRRLKDTTVTLVSCPLAPAWPVRKAFPRILATYRALLRRAQEEGETLIVAGDSSGGNIALCLVLWDLMSRGGGAGEAPSAVVGICPSTDLRHEHDAIELTTKLDPMQSLQLIRETARAWCPTPDGDTEGKGEAEIEGEGKAWRLDWGFEDPRVSPVQADVGLLARHGVRLYGISASYDVLGPEADEFAQRCRKEGVCGEWLRWQNQMHCFPLAWRFKLRESQESVDWLVERLARV